MRNQKKLLPGWGDGKAKPTRSREASEAGAVVGQGIRPKVWTRRGMKQGEGASIPRICMYVCMYYNWVVGVGCICGIKPECTHLFLSLFFCLWIKSEQFLTFVWRRTARGRGGHRGMGGGQRRPKRTAAVAPMPPNQCWSRSTEHAPNSPPSPSPYIIYVILSLLLLLI